MGKVFEAMVALTDSRRCFFNPPTFCFFTLAGKEALSFKTVALLEQMLQVRGLTGLSRMLGMLISVELERFYSKLKGQKSPDISSLLENPNALDLASSLRQHPSAQLTVSLCTKIGQLIWLRKIMTLFVEMRARQTSPMLYRLLCSLNEQAVEEVRPEAQQEQLLVQLTRLSEELGLTDPSAIVYAEGPSSTLASELFVGLLLAVTLSDYSAESKGFVRKAKTDH